MKKVIVAMVVVSLCWMAASTASAGYPRQFGYRSSVAPRTYLYGQGGPGLYPSRFGSGFGGYNPGYSGRGYGYHAPAYGAGYGGGYGYDNYGGQQVQQINIYLGR